jgi:hypothetical protein
VPVIYSLIRRNAPRDLDRALDEEELAPVA